MLFQRSDVPCAFLHLVQQRPGDEAKVPEEVFAQFKGTCSFRCRLKTRHSEFDGLAALQVEGLASSTQAALSAIAAEIANASDRYARDYDAHLAPAGPVPFQIPGD